MRRGGGHSLTTIEAMAQGECRLGPVRSFQRSIRRCSGNGSALGRLMAEFFNIWVKSPRYWRNTKRREEEVLMLKRFCAIVLGASLTLFISAAAEKKPTQREVKVQKTSLTRDQEVDLGKQAAAEVEREMEVIKNPEIESWLNNIGQKLAKTKQANSYPYYFKLVNEDSINAFALPGGPMFVHTGLIKSADNEGQVAGVLGHEMSHVALRHGAAQMGKAQTWQTILGVAGAAAGVAGVGGGLLGTAINTGGSMGVAGVLSKYSRDAERDADLNGARMLAAANYNPVEMARFFETLEEKMGDAARPKGLDAWFA